MFVSIVHALDTRKRSQKNDFIIHYESIVFHRTDNCQSDRESKEDGHYRRYNAREISPWIIEVKMVFLQSLRVA